jgi:hypothetical protein
MSLHYLQQSDHCQSDTLETRLQSLQELNDRLQCLIHQHAVIVQDDGRSISDLQDALSTASQDSARHHHLINATQHDILVHNGLFHPYPDEELVQLLKDRDDVSMQVCHCQTQLGALQLQLAELEKQSQQAKNQVETQKEAVVSERVRDELAFQNQRYDIASNTFQAMVLESNINWTTNASLRSLILRDK